MELDEDKIERFASEQAFVYGMKTIEQVIEGFGLQAKILKITFGLSFFLWLASLAVASVGTVLWGFGQAFVAGFSIWGLSLIALATTCGLVFLFVMKIQRLATGNAMLWLGDVICYVTGLSPDNRLVKLVSSTTIKLLIKEDKKERRTDHMGY